MQNINLLCDHCVLSNGYHNIVDYEDLNRAVQTNYVIVIHTNKMCDNCSTRVETFANALENEGFEFYNDDEIQLVYNVSYRRTYGHFKISCKSIIDINIYFDSLFDFPKSVINEETLLNSIRLGTIIEIEPDFESKFIEFKTKFEAFNNKITLSRVEMPIGVMMTQINYVAIAKTFTKCAIKK